MVTCSLIQKGAAHTPTKEAGGTKGYLATLSLGDMDTKGVEEAIKVIRVGLNGEDKGPSGIDKGPFVERKFEGAAWSCVLG